MKISFHWLCDYVDGLSKVDPFYLAREFTLKSFEVEEVFDQKKSFEKMVVGKIKKIQKHPSADKLLLVDTDIGKTKTIQIVCGCTNLEEGQLVFVALPGARARWHGQGNLITVEEAEVRGQKSFGMICTAVEVGLKDLLGQTHDKEACILDFTHVAAGTPISKALGLNDFIIDVDNKTLTNRPDLWGHIGIAREAAAITGKKFIYALSLYKGKFGSQKFLVEIRDKKICPRYSGVVIKNITVEKSPYWIRKRLWSVDIRPINNLVDITNYVMLELGEPMHVFDRDKISGSKIIVDSIKKTQKVKTLDEKVYDIPKDSIVIRDVKDIQAVAGIIGGGSSEISHATTTCFFEAANFCAARIRKTSNAIGLRTDASARHEKSLDPQYTLQAINRALCLIKEFCPSAYADSKIIDVYSNKTKSISINISHDYLEKKIGALLKKDFIIKTLSSLAFIIREKKGKYIITVPSFRATKDIKTQDDIVEEVARMYGYNNITPEFPTAPMEPPKKIRHLIFERTLKDIMACDLGFWEIYLHVFEDEKIFNTLGYEQSDFVEIQNAVQKDLRFLKIDLLPGLLRTVKMNERQYPCGKLFEFGRVFLNSKKTKEGLPSETRKLGLVQFGDEGDFFTLKGTLEYVFETIGIRDMVTYESPETAQRFFSDKHARITLQKKEIGCIGEVSERLTHFFHLKSRVYAAQLDFSTMLLCSKDNRVYREIQKFPSIELDISVIVPANVLWYTIAHELKTFESNMIESIQLFDVFESSTFDTFDGAKDASLSVNPEQAPAFRPESRRVDSAQKSIAFRVTYRSKERTLSLEEVMPIHSRIMKILEEKFNGKIRN